MICAPCRDAADRQLPRDLHCVDPSCMCGHRTDRYRKADPEPEVAVSGEVGQVEGPPLEPGAALRHVQAQSGVAPQVVHGLCLR